MSAAVSMRGAAAGAAVAIDFSKPVPASVLADAAGIDPARIHGRARRMRLGLVDVAPPLPGGRKAWVTGESAKAFFAKAFFEAAAAHRLALFESALIAWHACAKTLQIEKERSARNTAAATRSAA